MSYDYRVLWTLPFQPEHIDRHQLANDDDLPLCWTLVKLGSRKAPVACFRRETEQGTMYEPIYLEFSPETTMPYLQLASGPLKDGEGEYTFASPLPEQMQGRAVGAGGDWVPVNVRPVLASAELDGYGEDYGIAVAYALCDVIKECDPFVVDMGRALHGRLRQVLMVDGEIWEPLYYAWGQL